MLQEFIDFLLVLGFAVGIAGGLGVLYSCGLRLWAHGSLNNNGNVRIINRLGSVICFSVCVIIVLFALWLMIPMFH